MIAMRRENEHKALPPLVEILLARGDEEAARAADPSMRKLAGAAGDVMFKWMLGEVSFVARAA